MGRKKTARKVYPKTGYPRKKKDDKPDWRSLPRKSTQLRDRTFTMRLTNAELEAIRTVAGVRKMSVTDFLICSSLRVKSREQLVVSRKA